MSRHSCIYCRATAPTVPFNREHVLQQGFGRFQGALVLQNSVCQPCNSFFSSTIDLALTRDSVEGLERYRWGIKTPREEERPLAARIVPSAAVRRRDSDGFVSFSEREILSGEWNTAAVDYTRGLKLFGSDDATARMRAALEQQGVELDYRPLTFVEPDPENTIVQYEFTIPAEVQRGIAKIAFNYLAYRRGASFVLVRAFDPIRRFIRMGVAPELPPVDTAHDVPFRTSAPDGHVPVVHWVSLESHPDHRNLLGVVSLFTFLRHTVVLAEDFHGPWFDLPVAHLYNPNKLTVSEIEPVKPRWKHEDRPH